MAATIERAKTVGSKKEAGAKPQRKLSDRFLGLSEAVKHARKAVNGFKGYETVRQNTVKHLTQALNEAAAVGAYTQEEVDEKVAYLNSADSNQLAAAAEDICKDVLFKRSQKA